MSQNFLHPIKAIEAWFRRIALEEAAKVELSFCEARQALFTDLTTTIAAFKQEMAGISIGAVAKAEADISQAIADVTERLVTRLKQCSLDDLLKGPLAVDKASPEQLAADHALRHPIYKR